MIKCYYINKIVLVHADPVIFDPTPIIVGIQFKLMAQIFVQFIIQLFEWIINIKLQKLLIINKFIIVVFKLIV